MNGELLDRAIGELVGDSRWGEVKPSAMVPPDDDELSPPAMRAVDKLRAGTRPNPDEIEALTTGFRTQRPSLRVMAGDVDELPAGSSLRAGWALFLQVIRPLVASVGRIDRGTKAIGTGFLIAPRTVVTNRHVAARLTQSGDLVPNARIAFGRENEAPATAGSTRLTAIIAVHPTLDLAMLQLDDDGEARHPLELAELRPDPGAAVAVVGYPFPDHDRNPLFSDAVFDEPFGVERVSPGEVTDIRAGEVWHDCSTLGGNSGSPLVSRATGKVVGVHFDGSFLGRNKAVDATDLAAFITGAARDP